MTRFRFHRGSLADSLDTTTDVESVGDFMLLPEIQEIHKPGKSVVQQYLKFDHRCGWDTYLIYEDGAVFGMSDGPIKGITTVKTTNPE